VQTPGGKVVDYDIIGQRHDGSLLSRSNEITPMSNGGAVIVVAWDTRTKTATLIREYNPGCHKVLYGPAAGLIESGDKHENSNPLIAAQMELEEECHLAGGRWHRLVTSQTSSGGFGGVFMDKYVSTEIVPYLVLDATRVQDPRPCDAEEEIQIVHGVTAEEMWRMVQQGDMNLVGSWATLLALEKLRELGEIQ